MLKGGILSNNEKQKLKMKKNALEHVDFENEKKLDPKYKTEMCKSWADTGFCVYGNKCRFAHGRKELFEKHLGGMKYKQKACNSFKETGVCMYGSRCNFRHDERKLSEMFRSYFTHRLTSYPTHEGKSVRLSVFEKIASCPSETNSGNTSTSSLSPVSNKNISFYPSNNMIPFIPSFPSYSQINTCQQLFINPYSCFSPLMTKQY